MDNKEFNSHFKNRTMQLALDIMKFYSILKKNDAVRIMGKQLIRSTTSVGANFRAAGLSRSLNEKFSKFCIVVEEADETIYWLELFNKCHLDIKVPEKVLTEANEIVKVMSACKRGLGRKIGKYK